MKSLKITKPRSTWSKICIGVCAAAAAVVLIVVVLALTVFRVRHAVTVINSVRLLRVNAGFNAAKLGVDINATLLIDLTVTNPNRATFRYPDGGAAGLYYRGALAGEAGIPPGEIGPGETVAMNVTLTLMAGRLIADARVYADLLAGALPLTTYERIAGEVVVLGLFKHRVVTYTTCDVIVDVAGQKLSHTDCRYHTKF